jgi:hypothetical protein
LYVNNDFPNLVRGQLTKRLNNTAEFLVGYIREKMSEEKHGRTYRIPGTSETYVASAPGSYPGDPAAEYPAIRTGNLFLGLSAQQTGHGSPRFAVGTNVPYAKYLEGSQIKEGIRPFIRRAVLEVGDILKQIMQDPNYQSTYATPSSNMAVMNP